MPRTVPITQAGFLVQISGLDYYFSEFSGLDDSAQTESYSDGLGNRLYKLVANRELAEFTLGKAFDPRRDKGLVDYFKNYCSGSEDQKTISITPVEYCPNPEPIGAALILYGCQPTGVTGFEVDKTATAISMLKLKFVADEYAYS